MYDNLIDDDLLTDDDILSMQEDGLFIDNVLLLHHAGPNKRRLSFNR